MNQTLTEQIKAKDAYNKILLKQVEVLKDALNEELNKEIAFNKFYDLEVKANLFIPGDND